MQEDQTINRITYAVVGFGLVAVVGSFFLWGAQAALAAGAGSLVAVGNWLGLRWVADRGRKSPKHMILLAPKTLGVLVAVYFLVVHSGLDVRGLAFGLGALVIGVVGGALGASRLYAQIGEEEGR
ncbi:MAG: hypothetical protein IT379_07605 [Deltaproteobacteria bacterium]|nr:hypothetical protein [Deltaproteobacteria bacterium]